MKMCRQCLIFGKKNCEPPKEYNEDDINHPYYDPKGKYGGEILGAINNGYTYEELEEFWDKLKGYASYLFNKSHAACYSVITLCTMYLMKKYPAKFIAALMSMQSNLDKADLYIKMAHKKGVKVITPDINNAQADFTAIDNTIIFGLNLVKSMGENTLNEILKLRPFNSLEDMLEKVPKKYSNKRIMYNLILSGAFDFEDTNRYRLINKLIELRKIKEDNIDNYLPALYTEDKCIEHETKILGTSITHELWWDSIQDGENFEQTFELKSVTTRKDKKGKMMCFPKLLKQGKEIDALIFASLYSKVKNSFDIDNVQAITILGKRDKNKIIINAVIDTQYKEMDLELDIDIND